MLEVWPDNEPALRIFRLIGTRWRIPPMGGVPMGLDWPSIYPLMDRLGLDDDGWNALHSDLMTMEGAALDTMREFAQKTDGR